ncbi:hypothetical protein BP6252_12638 [Coleophoma cylindrospora]|uniref:Uncharacterized protein n=1 Tax=Coleophoma cylindrospora TaxID=1849047 RepID=A0A3D8QCT5_9HELO|nr:hypothetical protein BP6252_12638 [Coleophoma cylindrospora]
MIDECQSNQDLVDLMNDGGNRYFAWNFVNLYYGGKATIEFRRGPGAEDVDNCFAWVEFSVTFVQAAILSGSIRGLEQYEQNVEGLRNFILNNTQPLNTPQAMQKIFNGKSGSLMVRKTPTLTTEQRVVLQKKTEVDDKKNLMLKKCIAAGMVAGN